MTMGLTTLLFQEEAIIEDLLNLAHIPNKKDWPHIAPIQVKTSISVMLSVYDKGASVMHYTINNKSFSKTLSD